MKNRRTKLYVTALALVIGVSPVLGCTAVPKANTSRPTVAVETTADAKEYRKSKTPTVKPETNQPAKPETKPVLPTPEVKPETSQPATPETKPVLPTPTVKPEVSKPVTPETKPVLPTPTVKPEVSKPATPQTKPVLPTPSVKPETKPVLPTPSVKPETKPVLPTPSVKPETKPVLPTPSVKPETKPETKPEPSTCKPCKPCKPEVKPEGKFTIDNFKIIQQSLEKLGVSPSELETMIKQGKKLVDVLNEKDISANKFRKVLYKEYCLTIKDGVKNKQITKEEGKLLQAAIKQKVMSWMKDR